MEEKKLKLVIADDEDIIREGMCNYVPWNELGYELVGSAYDGDMLLEIIDNEQVDVVVSDIHMPMKSGLDIADEVARRNLDISFVMVTGYSEFDYARRAIRSKKVYDYIVKPLNLEDFKELMMELRSDILQKRKNSINGYGSVEDDRLLATCLETHSRDIEAIVTAIAKGNEMEAKNALERLFAFFRENRYPITVIRRIALELSFRLRWTMIQRSLATSLWANGDPLWEIVGKENIEEIYQYIRESIDGYCRETDIEALKAVSPLVKACIAIIQEEYDDSTLSLQSLADRLKVSGNYLSSCFKKETGIGFLKYVNGLRIIKAQELLKDVTLRTYEVALRVGIEDQRYFSRLFKELTGKTPSEYRSSILLP